MKQKIKKGASKRFKKTAAGKLLRRGGYSSHLKEKKGKSRLRRQKEPREVSPADKKRLVKFIG